MQRVTFFQDDDVTPLVGTVVGGVVTDPSFSTDLAHARPWLDEAENIGESELKFAEGTSTIGQLTFKLLDKRTVANDQTSGFFTALLAAATGSYFGNTQLLGRRVLFEQQEYDGTWHTLLDGVVSSVKMIDDEIVTYQVALRDILERGRKVRAWVKADQTTVFPYVGPASAYGRKKKTDAGGAVVDATDPIFLGVPGSFGTFRQAFDDGATTRWGQVEFLDNPSRRQLVVKYEELWKKYGQYVITGQTNVLGLLDVGEYRNMIVEWSAAGGLGPWTVLPTMQMNIGIVLAGSSPDLATNNAFVIVTDNGSRRLLHIKMNGPRALMPHDGDVIFVRVRSNMEPSEDVPQYFEENGAVLLRKLMDGDYSDPDVPPQMRYDSARVTALEVETPILRGKITAPADDLKGWLQKNWYAPLGYAPALRNGLIYPIRYAMPDASVPLVEFNDGNTQFPASWEHGMDNVITRVTFKYKQDVIPSFDPTLQGSLPEPQEIDAEYSEIATHAAVLLGTNELTYEPETFRVVVPTDSGGQPSAEFMVNDAERIAIQRVNEALDRFSQGAQQIILRARVSDPAVRDALEGDWAIVNLSWLPDYLTRKRGCYRLAQITKQKRLNKAWKEFTLLDAGPHGIPVPQVTVGALAANADGTLSLPVTALPVFDVAYTAEAEIQYALGEAMPVANSSLWMPFGPRIDATVTARSPWLPPGKAWVRYRGNHEGRRPSAWASAGSVIVPAAIGVYDYTLSETAGVPQLIWRVSSGAAGVRVYYELYADGAPAPTVLTNHADFAAGADGQNTVTLGVALSPLDQIAVKIVPYTGFGGGAVSGTAGTESVIKHVQRPQVVVTTPAPIGTVTFLSRTSTDELVYVDATTGDGSVADFQYRTNGGAWSALSPTPDSITVTRGVIVPVQLEVQFVQGDGQTTVVSYQVAARFDPTLHPSTGELDPGVAMFGGSFPFRAETSAGNEVPGDMKVKNTQQVKYVNPDLSPGVGQVIYRIPFMAFKDSFDQTLWDWSNLDARLRAVPVGSSKSLVAPLLLPYGSTIVGLSAHGYKQNSGTDLLQAAIAKIDDTSGVLIASCSHGTSGWATFSNVSISELVGASYLYTVNVAFWPAAAAADVRLKYVEVLINVPDLNTGL
jgi:hypothetical protein